MKINCLSLLFISSITLGQWSDQVQLTSGYTDINPQIRNSPIMLNYYDNLYFAFERQTPASTIWVGDLTNPSTITPSQIFPFIEGDTTQGFNPQIVGSFCLWEAIINAKRILLAADISNFPVVQIDTIESDISVAPYSLSPMYGDGCDYYTEGFIWSTENAIWTTGLYLNVSQIMQVQLSSNPGFGSYCEYAPGNVDIPFYLYQQNDSTYVSGYDFTKTYQNALNPTVHFSNLGIPTITFERIEDNATHVYQVLVDQDEIYWDSVAVIHPGIGSQTDFFSASYPLVVRDFPACVSGFVQENNNQSYIKAYYHEGDSINVSDTIGLHKNPTIGASYYGEAWIIWETGTDSSTELWARHFDDPWNGIEPDLQPNQFSLAQNYPNPFNPNTTIRYELQEQTFVRLSVFDLLGHEVVLLVNEVQIPATKEVQFDASALASGMYFYRLTVDSKQITKKLVVLK
ncbi:MAG: T9SS type A sorting domain-containing protein [Candidatus Marinimicrobia bacterium]|nr:T9SS type A sorting domain-containing protein [Candidatus Neomarinimicrobiota bacterium]